MSLSWSTRSSLVLVPVILLSILLIISLIFYKNCIHPYRNVSCWKVRRPSFLLFWLIVTISADLMNCAVRLMLQLNMLDHRTQFVISTIIQYHGGLTFGVIRIWLLFYDLKSCREAQQSLLSSRLKHQSDASLSSISIAPIDAGKRHKLGSSKAVTPRLLLFVTPMCLVTVILTLTGYLMWSKLMLFLYVFLMMIGYAYLLFSISCHCRCCSKKSKLRSSPFRDDWFLLLELTLLWIAWIIGIIAGFVATLFAKQLDAAVWVCWIAAILRIAIVAITCVIPYRSTKQTTSKKKHKTDFKTLKKVLSRKSTFFAFVEHLVHELSLENLTFLLEVWQFKFEGKYKLRLHSKVGSHEKWAQEIETSHEESSRSYATEQESENDTDKAFANDFMSDMPWNELPLAHSIALNANNKWKQCNAVFTKFLNVDSYDAVNIGYSARSEIYYKYTLLKRYKEIKSASKRALELVPYVNSNNPVEIMIQMDIAEVDRITTEPQFNAILLAVFDSALMEVMFNLIDSLQRFVKTEQFRAAH